MIIEQSDLQFLVITNLFWLHSFIYEIILYNHFTTPPPHPIYWKAPRRNFQILKKKIRASIVTLSKSPPAKPSATLGPLSSVKKKPSYGAALVLFYNCLPCILKTKSGQQKSLQELLLFKNHLHQNSCGISRGHRAVTWPVVSALGGPRCAPCGGSWQGGQGLGVCRCWGPCWLPGSQNQPCRCYEAQPLPPLLGQTSEQKKWHKN